jgi:hypothetical protein
MKYTKLFFLLFIGFASVVINASQKDVTKPGTFDPEIGARLFINGRFNPIARFSIFAPRGGTKKELVNRFSNCLIPSKQEVIEKALNTTVCPNKTIVSKLMALTSCVLLEAFKRYPHILDTSHSTYLDQQRRAGTQLEAAQLKPENAPISVKKEARDLAFIAAGKQAAYDCGKLYTISYLRSKMDPYINKAVQKYKFLQSIDTSHSQSAAAVRYIANRVVHGTIDIGFDAGYNFLKKQF